MSSARAQTTILLGMLTASCAKHGGAAPRITPDTLSTMIRCEQRIQPNYLGELTPKQEEKLAALALDEGFVRECGFHSVGEFARLRIRVSIALADARDADTMRKYPDGIPTEQRDRAVAAVEDRVRQGLATATDVDRKRQFFDKMDALFRRIAARRRAAQKAPLTTLDPAAFVNHDDLSAVTMGANSPSEAKQMLERYELGLRAIEAEARTQAPLSDDERALVHQYLQHP